VYRVVDGKAVPYAKSKSGEDEIIYGKDGETPQPMKEWLAERVSDAPHWFKESTGGGSRHQQPGGQGGGAAVKTNATGVNRMQAARESTGG